MTRKKETKIVHIDVTDLTVEQTAKRMKHEIHKHRKKDWHFSDSCAVQCANEGLVYRQHLLLTFCR